MLWVAVLRPRNWLVALLLMAATATGAYVAGRRSRHATPAEAHAQQPAAALAHPARPRADVPRFTLPAPPRPPDPVPGVRRLPTQAEQATYEERRARQAQLQAELDEVMEREVAPLRGEAEVSRYLDQLIARARQLRALPVTIVQPGFAAIDRLGLEAARREALVSRFEGQLDDVRRQLGL
jgi:hypothetical protein